MIIRIMGEGQWDVPESELAHLNRIDSCVEHAIEVSSQTELTRALTELGATIRRLGSPVADDVIVNSDLIVPDVAATLEEVSVWLSENSSGSGLIPG